MRILEVSDCHCPTCNGGTKPPEGYLGGTWCPCKCHTLKGEEHDRFVEERMKTFHDAVTDLLNKLAATEAEEGKT